MKGKIIIGILLFLTVVSVVVYFLVSQKRTTASEKIEELTPQTETDYTRRFVGRVQNIDKPNATMTLVAQDERIYIFAVPKAMIDNNDADIAVPNGVLVEVKWRDALSMDEIMQRYEKDPSGAVNKGDSAIAITLVE